MNEEQKEHCGLCGNVAVYSVTLPNSFVNPTCYESYFYCEGCYSKYPEYARGSFKPIDTGKQLHFHVSPCNDEQELLNAVEQQLQVWENNQ